MNTTFSHEPDLQELWDDQFNQAGHCLATIRFMVREIATIDRSMKRYFRDAQTDLDMQPAQKLLHVLDPLRLEIHKMCYAINLHIQEMLSSGTLVVDCKSIRSEIQHLLNEYILRFRSVKQHFYLLCAQQREQENSRWRIARI